MNRSRLDTLIMEQEKRNSLSRADIEEIQLKKLNELLLREHERQGFYRDLPERVGSLEELKALPFTTRVLLWFRHLRECFTVFSFTVRSFPKKSVILSILP